MGKYQTYSKRGSPEAGLHQLHAPPAPTLYTSKNDVYQQANGLDDLGGEVKLYTAGNINGPWTLSGSHDWVRLWIWGSVEFWSDNYLRATENGNGWTYQGESEPSNILDLT